MSTQTTKTIEAGGRIIFQRILVPIDGSPASRHAAAVASSFSRAFAGCVRLIFVLDVERVGNDLSVWTERDLGEIFGALRTNAEAALATAASEARESGVAAETALVDGDVVEQILLDAAAWKADVVVMGTHSRGMALSPALGSKTAELLRRTALPVLVVR